MKERGQRWFDIVGNIFETRRRREVYISRIVMSINVVLREVNLPRGLLVFLYTQRPMKPLREAVRLLEKVSPIRRSECDRKKKEQSCRWMSGGFKCPGPTPRLRCTTTPFTRQTSAVHHASSPECKPNFYWIATLAGLRPLFCPW
jgi:hypothetical protein